VYRRGDNKGVLETWRERRKENREAGNVGGQRNEKREKI
jgi:hypothetical protein